MGEAVPFEAGLLAHLSFMQPREFFQLVATANLLENADCQSSLHT